MQCWCIHRYGLQTYLYNQEGVQPTMVMNNNNNNNSQVLYLPDCTVHENLSQNRWTIRQAIAVMTSYNFNRELQQTIIDIVAARRVPQIERLMRWMDLSEYRLAPNNQIITRSQNRCSNWWEFDAPNNQSITRYWSDDFLRSFVRQRDNSNWNTLRTLRMGNPNEAPY